MRLVRLQWGLALLLAIGVLGFGHVAHAQGISQKVATCDPKFPNNCLKPASDGSIAVTGGGGGGGSGGTATAAAPTYVEGATNQPLSLNLAGALRVVLQGTTNGLALDASVGTTNTDLGPPGATACATDTGACSLNALLQRIAQRLTTVNTTIGSSVTGYAQGSTTSGQLGPLQQVAITTAAPTYTTAQTSPQSADIHGAARTLNMDASGNPLDATLTVPTAQIGPYPGTNTAGVVTAAAPITCSSGNVANGTVACTLSGASSKTTYIQGMMMTSDGATVALGVTCTITGMVSGTMTFTYEYGVITAQNNPLVVNFGPGVPASTTNTSLVLSCPASGAGGAHAAISAWGYQL